MSEAEFWTIIDRTQVVHEDHNVARELQCRRLEELLEGMELREVASFDRRFVMLLRKSYGWQLWNAIWYLDGASDDGFEYFRYWLISKGRERFYAACEDPDRFLAAYAGSKESLAFEEFRGVVNLRLADCDSSYLDDLLPYGEPSSDGFPDDATEADFPEIYPLITAALARHAERSE